MNVQADFATDPSGKGADDIVLAVRNLKKHFPIRDGVFQRVIGHVKAVDGVSFNIRRGETVGLVGESGCGKSTLGRCVSGLSDPTSGGVYFGISAADCARLDEHQSTGASVPSPDIADIEARHRIDLLEGHAQRRFRRNCQMVFQDSFASLNPRHLVVDIVGRPLRVYKEASGAELTERVVALLEQVGLGRHHLYRYPHQFSGGQRQRISIARALALDPELIVLDEPTSALDVSVQAQILNLLNDLQRDHHLAYLFITHDLAVVQHMADRLVAMYLGRVSETGETKTVFEDPQHPYTLALMAAKPDLTDDEGAKLQALEGNIPDPARPPQGCRFHTRCPAATPICGWEIDDVVRWLEESPGMFDTLAGVERGSAFDASLRFSDTGSAERLAAALRSPEMPAAMQHAMEELSVDGASVRIRFQEVDEVQLTDRGSNHHVACVLDPRKD